MVVCCCNRGYCICNDLSVLLILKFYVLKKSALILILILLVTIPADAQCAMCRAVLESEDGGATAKGVNNGIMYLMVFPYLLVGAIGYMVYSSRKKDKKKLSN